MSIGRRTLLKYLGATGAAAAIPSGLVGCTVNVTDGAKQSTDGLREVASSLYPPVPGADPMGFLGQFENAAGERSYVAKVDGKLPPQLRGTLYRNGPGLVERAGVRKGNVIDGDGMIRAYRFDGKNVEFKNRFVRTPKFMEEEAAGVWLYDTMSLALGKGPTPEGRGNQAGVTCVVQDGKLYALDHGELPFSIDPNDLATRGIAESWTQGGPPAYAAHYRIDEANGDWILFINDGPALIIHTFDKHARRKAPPRVVMAPRGALMHDFFVSDRHIIFYMHPADIDGERIPEVGVGRAVTWNPSASTILAVVPRDPSLEPMFLETEGHFMWHTINAFERGSEIIADYIGYAAPDHFVITNPNVEPAMWAYMKGQNADWGSPGHVRRMIIDVQRRSVRQEVLDRGNNEFPKMNLTFSCHEYRHAYYLQMKPGGGWWSRVVKLDTRTGATEQFDFGDGYFLSEPVYAPMPGKPSSVALAREPGFLLQPLYETATGKSSLAILRADAIADGPIAAVRLQDHDPFAFHGFWNAA